jgi:hypothetical protein
MTKTKTPLPAAVRRANAAGYRSDFTSAAGMKEHGWTRTAIEKFLGEPDKLAVNPHCGSGPPMRLYEVKRVLRAQRSKTFQRWLEGKHSSSQTRSEAALKAAAVKREQTLQYVEELKIEVPVLSDREVLEQACQHYNERDLLSEKSARVPDVSHLDEVEEFYRRITVNYLRHEMTNYESELRSLHGRTGVDDAIDLLREKIYTAIGEAYPALRNECRRQEDKRREQSEMRRFSSNLRTDCSGDRQAGAISTCLKRT